MTPQDRDILWNALCLSEENYTTEQWEEIVWAFARLDGLLQLQAAVWETDDRYEAWRHTIGGEESLDSMSAVIEAVYRQRLLLNGAASNQDSDLTHDPKGSGR